MGQLVEALHYTPEGHGFDYRWCHWQSFRPYYRSEVDSAFNKNEYQEYFLGGKAWQPYDLHLQTALKSGSLNLLELSTGIALPLPLLGWRYWRGNQNQPAKKLGWSQRPLAYLADAKGFPALTAGIYLVLRVLESCRLSVNVTVSPMAEGKKFGRMNFRVLNQERLVRVGRRPLRPGRKIRWLRDSVILGWRDAYRVPSFIYTLTFAL